MCDTFIKVVHTEFINVFRTAFKRLSKMSEEQVAAAAFIVLISENNKSRKKRQEKKFDMKPWFKRRKNLVFYETLLVELRLEYEYDNKNYL